MSSRLTVHPGFYALPIAIALAGAAAHCTPQQETKTVKDVQTAVQVADGTCQIVEQNVADLPDWVTVACGVVGTVDKVKVTMPKAAWSAVKAASRDAGPGK